MPIGRVVPKRIPVCPGRDSRFTIKHNSTMPGNPWWVYYDSIPADDPHTELVTLVNEIKSQLCGSEGGGAFSINEHGQVIARMSAPGGYPGDANALHAIGIDRGNVRSYAQPLIFNRGALDPRSAPAVGAPWVGPLCGTTYSFAAQGNPKSPSNNFDEIFIEVAGSTVLLSIDSGISRYPPASGPLASFLGELRRRLPDGGRFRVNEHGRAFTARDSLYVGTVPLTSWFRPLTAQS